MRLRARVDANQKDIVVALRAIGAEVTHLHAVGKGVPDLLVSYRGFWFVLEVKDGSKPPSARKLTPDQVAWGKHQNASWFVVDSAAEAVDLLLTQGALYHREFGTIAA